MKKSVKAILAIILSFVTVFLTVVPVFSLEESESDSSNSVPDTTEETMAPQVFEKGDVTKDGNVTSADARLALRATASLINLKEIDFKLADFNEDGSLTAADARCILRFSAKLDPFKEPETTTKAPETTTKKPETTTKRPASAARKYTIATSKKFSTNYAQYAVLYDYDNDKVLYMKNAHALCHPASTTKLITASLGCEYLGADYVLTVGSELNLMEWNTSRAGIYQGQRIKFKEILKCLLVPSGCDAAYTIAVNVARVASGNKNMSASKALSYFVSMMNTYAKKLGMNDSHFANPDGFPNSNHYVSAYDMMIIGAKAYSFSLIRNVVNQPWATAYFVSGGSAAYTNSDELINPYSSRYYPYAVGMKTGSHSQAGQCLVSAAKKNGRTFIAVVMDCPSKYGRYSDLVGLFNTAFANYK